MSDDTIRVSGTLSVGIHTSAGDLHVTIERTGAGLVRVEPHELRALVAALVEVAGRCSVSGDGER